jgi:hypothetical protein
MDAQRLLKSFLARNERVACPSASFLRASTGNLTVIMANREAPRAPR